MAEDYYAVEKMKEEQKKSRVKVKWAFKEKNREKGICEEKDTYRSARSDWYSVWSRGVFGGFSCERHGARISDAIYEKNEVVLARIDVSTFGVVIAGAITGALAIWRNGVQEQVAQTEADEKAEEEEESCAPTCCTEIEKGERSLCTKRVHKDCKEKLQASHTRL